MNAYQIFSPRLLVFSGHVRHRREVELQLRRMQAIAAGRNVMKFISAGSRDVRIPFALVSTSDEPVNAYARFDLSENRDELSDHDACAGVAPFLCGSTKSTRAESSLRRVAGQL